MALTLGALAAGAAISGGISAISGFMQQRRENKALEARKAWAGEEKAYNKKVFELETFQRYYSTEQAGAQRIFMASGLGGGTKGALALNQFDEFMLDRDLVLSEFQFQHQQRRIDQDIKNLDMQKVSPWAKAGWQFAGSAIESGAAIWGGAGAPGWGKMTGAAK